MKHLSANNLNAQGADIINDGRGDTVIQAKNDMNLTALSVGYDEKLGTGNRYRHEKAEKAVVSTVKGKGDVTITGKNIRAEGAELESEAKLLAVAENDLVLNGAQESQNLEEFHKTKSGSVAKVTKTSFDKQQSETQRGTQVSGKEVVLAAGHDVKGKGLQAIAENDLLIQAGHEESRNWLGWRSENHSRDEEMYRAINGKYEAIENYKNSFNGKLAYSVKDGLELATMIYSGGLLSNALSKLPAAASSLNLPSKAASAAGKVGDFAKAHPLLTEKFVNSGTSMGFTYLGKSLSGKETSASDLLWSGGTGFATGGKDLKGTVAINTASGVAKEYMEGKEPMYAGGAALISTLAGSGTGGANAKRRL